MQNKASAARGIEIRWFPPSWLLIKTPNKILYIDPAWIQKEFDLYPPRVIFSHHPDAMDGLPEPDLPRADIVLITHHHQDHVKTATLNRLVTDHTAIFAPAKCAELIGREFHRVQPGAEADQDDVHIKAVHAYNTPEGHSTNKFHHKGEGVGYLLTVGGHTLYHAGDTDFIPEMKELGSVDVAFLPVGGTYTMDAGEAVQAARAIRPRVLVPMHFLKSTSAAFRQHSTGLGKTTLEVLDIGGSLNL
jgi:L-ascorbate metabolism protein UlaG (beta-lactamase superfamily)